MTVLSFFHNSVDGDRKYESDDFAKHTSAIINDGVVEGLKVTYTNAYAYTIDVGKAIVMGRSVVNDAVIATSIGTPVNGDVWSVVVRMDLTARAASIETILGTTYQNDNAIKQIPLATILVGTNTLTVTDKRDYVSYKSNKLKIHNSKLRYTHENGVNLYEAVAFREGSDASGVGMAVTGSGTTIIGGGESAYDILNSLTLVPDPIEEKLLLTSDYHIELMVGMQTVKTQPTTGKRFMFNSNGDLNIGGSNVDLQTMTIRYTPASKLLQMFHWTGTAVSDTVLLEIGNISIQNPGWVNLSLTSGITEWSSANTPEYCKKSDVVYVQGAIKGITAVGKVIATLPSGFRPRKTVSFALPTSGKDFARWAIGTDGAITLENTSSATAPLAGDWFPITMSFSI